MSVWLVRLFDKLIDFFEVVGVVIFVLLSVMTVLFFVLIFAAVKLIFILGIALVLILAVMHCFGVSVNWQVLTSFF